MSNFCNVNSKAQVCENSATSGCPAPGASQTDCCLVCSTPEPESSLDFTPCNIASAYTAGLSSKAMSMTARHCGNVSVYDAHNLCGLTEQIGTNNALTDIRGKRPCLLSRSSFLCNGENGKFAFLPFARFLVHLFITACSLPLIYFASLHSFFRCHPG